MIMNMNATAQMVTGPQVKPRSKPKESLITLAHVIDFLKVIDGRLTEMQKQLDRLEHRRWVQENR